MTAYAYLPRESKKNKKYLQGYSEKNTLQIKEIIVAKSKNHHLKPGKKKNINTLIKKLKVNDAILVHDVFSVARAIRPVLNFLSMILQKKIKIIFAKYAIEFSEKSDLKIVFCLLRQIFEDIESKKKQYSTPEKTRNTKNISDIGNQKELIVNLMESNLSTRKIAKEIGCTQNQFENWLRKNGYSFKKLFRQFEKKRCYYKPSRIDPIIDQIYSLMNAGLNMTDIAKRINCDVYYFRNWLKSKNIKRITIYYKRGIALLNPSPSALKNKKIPSR